MRMREDRKIPDLVSVTQAAALLGVTRQRVLQLVQEGVLDGKKVGATWVFRRVMVELLAGIFEEARADRSAEPITNGEAPDSAT